MPPSAGAATRAELDELRQSVQGLHADVRSSKRQQTSYHDADLHRVRTNSVLKQMRSREHKSRWDMLIDPRTSKVLGYWDMIGGLALLFTAIITPYEVAFLAPSTSPLAFLFLVNRFVDLIYFLDILVTFRTMYKYYGRNGQELWMDNARQIERHYASTWLVPDLVTVLISGVDVVSLYVKADAAESARSLRVLRVIRLLKLVRIVKGSKVVKRLLLRVHVPYQMLAILKSILLLLAITHWSACLLGLLAEPPFTSSKTNSWLSTFGYCTETVCGHEFDLYGASFGWALLMVVGEREPEFGPYEPVCLAAHDANGAAYCDGRLNNVERVVRTVMMILYAFMWTYVTAVFVDVLSNADPGTRDLRNRMEDLNDLLSRYSVPWEMRPRMREYLHETSHVHDTERAKSVLSYLSPGLKGALMKHANMAWFKSVPFLRGEAELQALVATALSGVVLPQGEWCSKHSLYVIHRGTILYKGGIRGPGKAFGHKSIQPRHFVKQPRAYALSYVHLYYIEGQKLMDLAQGSAPSVFHRMNTWARWQMAFEFALSRLIFEAQPANGREWVAIGAELPYRAEELTRSSRLCTDDTTPDDGVADGAAARLIDLLHDRVGSWMAHQHKEKAKTARAPPPGADGPEDGDGGRLEEQLRRVTLTLQDWRIVAWPGVEAGVKQLTTNHVVKIHGLYYMPETSPNEEEGSNMDGQWNGFFNPGAVTQSLADSRQFRELQSEQAAARMSQTVLEKLEPALEPALRKVLATRGGVSAAPSRLEAPSHASSAGAITEAEPPLSDAVIAAMEGKIDAAVQKALAPIATQLEAAVRALAPPAPSPALVPLLAAPASPAGSNREEDGESGLGLVTAAMVVPPSGVSSTASMAAGSSRGAASTHAPIGAQRGRARAAARPGVKV